MILCLILFPILHIQVFYQLIVAMVFEDAAWRVKIGARRAVSTDWMSNFLKYEVILTSSMN